MTEFSNLWGPPPKAPSTLPFSDAPYAPFSKGDKLGKAADWASDPAKEGKDQRRVQGRGFRDPYHAYGASSTTFFTNDDTDSSWSFSIVDSNAKAAPKPRQQNAVLKTRGRMQGQVSAQGPGGRQIGQATSLANRDRLGRRPGAWNMDKSKNREPSIAIGPNWTLIQSNNFGELNKLSYDVSISSGKVLSRHGNVQYFDKSMDKSTQPIKLRPVDCTVLNVTTSEDPVISELAKKNKGSVFVTDSILSVIMSATKSNNPWDILVTKENGKIFFDKRDGGPLDYLTVDENSGFAPSEDAENHIDSASSLAVEATYINHNFAANVVKGDDVYKFETESPFASVEDEPLLAKGYIYREFNLEADPEKEPIIMVVRCEVDAATTTPDGDSALVCVRALNEYGGHKPLEWKDRFANHRGAIVAAEMKNNLNKLSQWTIQALLSGADYLKIGFVSRINAKEKTQHEIIGVLTRDPAQFATQLNLHIANSWGIVKSLVNIFSSLGDGRYVILRDPNLQLLRVYRMA